MATTLNRQYHSNTKIKYLSNNNSRKMLKSREETQVALVDNTHTKSTKTTQKILEEEEYLKV